MKGKKLILQILTTTVEFSAAASSAFPSCELAVEDSRPGCWSVTVTGTKSGMVDFKALPATCAPSCETVYQTNRVNESKSKRITNSWRLSAKLQTYSVVPWSRTRARSFACIFHKGDRWKLSLQNRPNDSFHLSPVKFGICHVVSTAWIQ